MTNVWSDPQFYVVTAVALGGLWAVVRPFLKSARTPEAGCPTCDLCPSSKTAAAKGPKAGGGPPLVVIGRGDS
jgi:hypothetical protein